MTTEPTTPTAHAEAIDETFEQAAERLGHKLRRDEDGCIDIFVMDSGYHNGPGCELCDESWCHHCTSPKDIEPCTTPHRSHEMSGREELLQVLGDVLEYMNERYDADHDGVSFVANEEMRLGLAVQEQIEILTRPRPADGGDALSALQAELDAVRGERDALASDMKKVAPILIDWCGKVSDARIKHTALVAGMKWLADRVEGLQVDGSTISSELRALLAGRE